MTIDNRKHFHLILDDKAAFQAIVPKGELPKIVTVDNGIAFYISQLEQLEARVYETFYRNIVFMEYVPVETDLPDWVDQWSYISFDAVTMGKFVGAKPTDIPRATINRSKTTANLFLGGIGYDYTIDELRKSQAMGQSLDTAEAEAARRGYLEHAQRVAFMGDSTRNITGLLNNVNIQTSNAPDDGTGTTRTFSTKTPDQVVRDMNQALITVWVNSQETHIPNVLLLPSAIWASLGTRRMDDTSTMTILEYFRMNNLYTQRTQQPLMIMPLLELDTAGAGNTNRMMAYELNNTNLTMKMPISLRFLPPQQKGFAISVDGEYKFGGVEFRYPGSAAYVDGI